MNKQRTAARRIGSIVGKKIREPRIPYKADAMADVNLSIKVPLTLRQHWAAEAKREGTTLTAVIMDALTKRFGGP